MLSDGVLTIRGTGAADTINFGVGKSSSRYLATVNGESYSFRHLDVGSIKILGVAGNDHITVQRFGLKDPVTALFEQSLWQFGFGARFVVVLKLDKLALP